MKFICKIVKDCVHSDGIRDYHFLDGDKFNLEFLLNSIRTEEVFRADNLEKKSLADKEYIRLKGKFFKLFGFYGEPKIRVEFQDFHPSEIREKLELIFDNY